MAEIKRVAAKFTEQTSMKQDVLILQQGIVLANTGVGVISNQNKVSGVNSMTDVLESFNQGMGHWIPNECFIDSGKGNTEEARSAYRDKLSIQIQQLTGTKPRIVKEKNGTVEQWANMGK